MIEDKEFLQNVVNVNIVKVLDGATKLLEERKPLPYIYNYILRNSQDRDGYITMLLFGMRYERGYSDVKIK